jgi:hypothetical protein
MTPDGPNRALAATRNKHIKNMAEKELRNLF